MTVQKLAQSRVAQQTGSHPILPLMSLQASDGRCPHEVCSQSRSSRLELHDRVAYGSSLRLQARTTSVCHHHKRRCSRCAHLWTSRPSSTFLLCACPPSRRILYHRRHPSNLSSLEWCHRH